MNIMLSKEEIKESKAHLEMLLDYGILASEDEQPIKNILEYIEQLESDKQKLIEKLEKDIENANDNIKHMDEKNILQTIAGELAIGMRDYAQEILKIVKGTKE